MLSIKTPKNKTPKKPHTIPKTFIIDVDGVMTTGHFVYSLEGKIMKIFGPDDHDALSLLSPYINIQFITSDARGFTISQKRIVDDMKFPLEFVGAMKRLEWLSTYFNLNEV